MMTRQLVEMKESYMSANTVEEQKRVPEEVILAFLEEVENSRVLMRKIRVGTLKEKYIKRE